jgi:hypothetical protein
MDLDITMIFSAGSIFIFGSCLVDDFGKLQGHLVEISADQATSAVRQAAPARPGIVARPSAATSPRREPTPPLRPDTSPRLATPLCLSLTGRLLPAHGLRRPS